MHMGTAWGLPFFSTSAAGALKMLSVAHSSKLNPHSMYTCSQDQLKSSWQPWEELGHPLRSSRLLNHSPPPLKHVTPCIAHHTPAGLPAALLRTPLARSPTGTSGQQTVAAPPSAH